MAVLCIGCTLTAVPRSTQPSTPRGMVNKTVSTSWMSNNTNGDGRMFGLAYRRKKGRLQLGLQVGGHLALTHFHSEGPKYTRVLQKSIKLLGIKS